MIKNLVFIGGAAGVGKTTLCHRLQAHHWGYFRLFHAVQLEAMLIGLSPEKKLLAWDSLLSSALNRMIHTTMYSTVVVDMHYGFQKKGGVSIAFAKRGFSPTVNVSATCGSSFFRSVRASSVHVVCAIKLAPTEVIQQRQAQSGHTVLSSDSIRCEQDAELKYWHAFRKRLCFFGVPHRALLLNNVGTVADEVALIVPALNYINARAG